MIPCPECDHTDYHGKVEKEVHVRFGGTFEPVTAWIDCDICDGTGEVEEEEVLQMFRWDLSRNVMSEKYCTDGVMAVPKSSWNSISDLFRLNTADERLVGAVAVSMRKKMEMWRKRKS